MATEETGNQRVQFDIAPKMAKLLDRLVTETNATTRAEVLRRALSVYALLADELNIGTQIHLKGKDGNIRQVLLFPVSP